MKNTGQSLQQIAITLWVGGLWVTGYMAAPVLFASLSDRMLAGIIAGKMFAMIAYIGMVCGIYLLVYAIQKEGAGAFRERFFWAVFFMLLLTFAGHFGIQPIIQHLKDEALPLDVMKSVFKNRFEAWHGIASILYLVQSLIGLFVVLSRKG
ncbi:MAG TPA: DUF4149 domain-containing protein [Burkholderiales bacterium]|nr:DUF4149 domain-containing protein [Burkholderiales bacterium]